MNRSILLLALWSISSISLAQKPNDIVGVWLNEKKDGHIEVYKKGKQYFGKITWLQDNTNDDGSSPKLDTKNPDEARQSKPIVGSLIFKGLKWDAAEKEWNGGKIYDPRSGNTYSMFARLRNPKTLYLKGYIGFSLIGRSTTWTRLN